VPPSRTEGILVAYNLEADRRARGARMLAENDTSGIDVAELVQVALPLSDASVAIAFLHAETPQAIIRASSFMSYAYTAVKGSRCAAEMRRHYEWSP
jgi:hypothetical protein